MTCEGVVICLRICVRRFSDMCVWLPSLSPNAPLLLSLVNCSSQNFVPLPYLQFDKKNIAVKGGPVEEPLMHNLIIGINIFCQIVNSVTAVVAARSFGCCSTQG